MYIVISTILESNGVKRSQYMYHIYFIITKLDIIHKVKNTNIMVFKKFTLLFVL